MIYTGVSQTGTYEGTAGGLWVDNQLNHKSKINKYIFNKRKACFHHGIK